MIIHVFSSCLYHALPSHLGPRLCHHAMVRQRPVQLWQYSGTVIS